jgi:MOSC domain-containing protein YiiM
MPTSHVPEICKRSAENRPLTRSLNRSAPAIIQSVMKLISVNTGLPRRVLWEGQTVESGIFKQPVTGRVTLRKLNLDGDRQADLTVHGGQDKAVYCYPIAHYGYWRKELPDHDLPMGSFGENFTMESELEDAVHLGDRFSIGTAEVVVTQPRLPCYKLIVKFGIADMIKRFLASGRTGFYVSVAREGDVGAGDEIYRTTHDPGGTPISEITRLYLTKNYTTEDLARVEQALKIAALPESWKRYFRGRLDRIETSQ